MQMRYSLGLALTALLAAAAVLVVDPAATEPVAAAGTPAYVVIEDDCPWDDVL